MGGCPWLPAAKDVVYRPLATDQWIQAVALKTYCLSSQIWENDRYRCHFPIGWWKKSDCKMLENPTHSTIGEWWQVVYETGPLFSSQKGAVDTRWQRMLEIHRNSQTGINSTSNFIRCQRIRVCRQNSWLPSEKQTSKCKKWHVASFFLQLSMEIKKSMMFH